MTWRRLAATLRRQNRRTPRTLAIFERLAALDPTNTGWQQELAVAYGRVGDLAQARGDLTAARAGVHPGPGHLRAAGRARSRQHRLAGGPGGRAPLGRGPGAGSRRPGGGRTGVHPVPGHLRAAGRARSRQHQAGSRAWRSRTAGSGTWRRLAATWRRHEQAYAQDRAIFERLAALDPANTGWQREAGGRVQPGRGPGAGSRRPGGGTSRRTPRTWPSSSGWPRWIPPTPAGSRSWRSRTAGSVTWRRLAATWRRPSRRTPRTGPSPSGWPRWIPPTPGGSGSWRSRTAGSGTWRRLAATWRRHEQAYAQDLAIFERLAALDPANTGWQRELAVAYHSVGDLAQARGDLAAARAGVRPGPGHLRAAGRAGSRQHRLAAGAGGRVPPGRGPGAGSR